MIRPERRGQGGPTIGAHRVSWALANGPIPEGGQILHSCDNPPCCNPAHLRVGDHQANMDDMFSKGRRQAAVGERCGNVRLTAAQVREFRANYQGRRGELKAAIAHYGVHKNTLMAVAARRTWKHIP